jgi:hypothetical protein
MLHGCLAILRVVAVPAIALAMLETFLSPLVLSRRPPGAGSLAGVSSSAGRRDARAGCSPCRQPAVDPFLVLPP